MFEIRTEYVYILNAKCFEDILGQTFDLPTQSWEKSLESIYGS